MRKAYGLVLVVGLALSCAPRSRIATINTPPQPAMQRQIQNAIDAGDGDYRLRALRQRAALEPDNLQVRLELADAYRVRGYPDIALEHYRLASLRFPDAGEPQLGMVRMARALDSRAPAIAQLEAFLKRHPESSASFYSWLGILRDETGQFAAGEEAHRMAVARAPKTDSLRNNLGYNLLKQGKYAAAAAEFREALSLSPNSVIARNNLGLALANTASAEQAVSSLQSAADPATAHSNMAAILIEQHKYAEARKELEIALGYNRSHPIALKNLELVSRLDGAPASAPIGQFELRRRGWKSTIRRLFVGPLDDPPPPAARTASLR